MLGIVAGCQEARSQSLTPRPSRSLAKPARSTAALPRPGGPAKHTPHCQTCQHLLMLFCSVPPTNRSSSSNPSLHLGALPSCSCQPFLQPPNSSLFSSHTGTAAAVAAFGARRLQALKGNPLAVIHYPGAMMAMRTLPGLASSGLGSVSCQSTSNARIQYGLPRCQASRMRAHPNSLKTPSKLSFNPFFAGESLGVSKTVPVFRRGPPGYKISAQAAGDASASDAYSEETPKVGDVEIPKPVMGRVKIGIYFATWWALNVVFNIYNKKVLNAYPFPWLTSTLSLLAGSTIMLLSWALRIVPAPDVDADFWKGLAPVALAHTIGHVAATVSMSKVAVSFTHIIKSAEPAFSVIIQALLLGEKFPTSVYLSLLPIIGGCGLAAATELNFNMTGFVGAMVSNIAFVFRNIFSKKGMTTGKSVGGMNYYACLSMMSLVLLTPFAIAVEGPKNWVTGWEVAKNAVGPQIFWWVVAQSVFYHLYNQVSYMSLNEISPLTFSIGNTMKRVTVIVSSIIIFHTQVRPINAVGAAIAIIGTFLYSQAKQ